MKKINVPSYGHLIPRDHRIKAIMDLYYHLNKQSEELEEEIKTSAATFKGTFSSLEELQKAEADANDYAYVETADANGHAAYMHYRYVEGSGWTYEYTMNETSFSEEEWAAIQSGATKELIDRLKALPDAADLSTQWVLNYSFATTTDIPDPITETPTLNDTSITAEQLWNHTNNGQIVEPTNIIVHFEYPTTFYGYDAYPSLAYKDFRCIEFKDLKNGPNPSRRYYFDYFVMVVTKTITDGSASYEVSWEYCKDTVILYTNIVVGDKDMNMRTLKPYMGTDTPLDIDYGRSNTTKDTIIWDMVFCNTLILRMPWDIEYSEPYPEGLGAGPGVGNFQSICTSKTFDQTTGNTIRFNFDGFSLYTKSSFTSKQDGKLYVEANGENQNIVYGNIAVYSDGFSISSLEYSSANLFAPRQDKSFSAYSSYDGDPVFMVSNLIFVANITTSDNTNTVIQKVYPCKGYIYDVDGKYRYLFGEFDLVADVDNKTVTATTPLNVIIFTPGPYGTYVYRGFGNDKWRLAIPSQHNSDTGAIYNQLETLRQYGFSTVYLKFGGGGPDGELDYVTTQASIQRHVSGTNTFEYLLSSSICNVLVYKDHVEFKDNTYTLPTIDSIIENEGETSTSAGLLSVADYGQLRADANTAVASVNATTVDNAANGIPSDLTNLPDVDKVTVTLSRKEMSDLTTTLGAATDTSAGVMTKEQVSHLESVYNDAIRSITIDGKSADNINLLIAAMGNDTLTLPPATTAEAGVMTATDKTDLDTNTQSRPTKLSYSQGVGSVALKLTLNGAEDLSSGDIPTASDTLAGVMSAQQKKDLDSNTQSKPTALSVTADATKATATLTLNGATDLSAEIPQVTTEKAGLAPATDWSELMIAKSYAFDNNTAMQSLTNRVEELENKTLLDTLSYGVEWDVTKSTPKCTRVGNMSMHKSLPIQSSLKGCVFTKDGVKYYLDPNDWTKKADGTEAKLDGTDGDVGVHHMKYYIRSWTSVDGDTNKRQVRISTFKIDDSWVEVPEGIVSAYHTSIDTTDSTTLKARSVVNRTAAFRGGNNSATHDDAVSPLQSNLGKPRTNLNRATFRTYARNSGYELLDYTSYKNVIYWLFVIEYATFNSQDTFTEELTSEGYHQGGLGQGVTNVGSSLWEILTGYNPVIPNGFTDSLGNQTGVVQTEALTDYQVTSMNKNFNDSLWITPNATASRNSENKSVTFSQINFGNTTSRNILYCSHYNACGEYGFTVSGLTDSSITLSVRQGETELLSITADGSYTVTFDATNKEIRSVYAITADATGNKDCSLSLATTSLPANVEIGVDIRSLEVPRYRGIEQPFGDVFNITDGMLGVITETGGVEKIYVTDNPDYYSDSDVSNMRLIGEIPEGGGGWIKSLNLGETAEIVPESLGANSTTYMTDYCYRGISVNTYSLILGGDADGGSYAGLGCFCVNIGVGWAYAIGGCRLYKKL